MIYSIARRAQNDYTISNMIDLTTEKIPPGQQLIAADKWPTIGEKNPSHTDEPWTLQLGGLVNQESPFVVDELRAFPLTTLRMDIHLSLIHI